MGEILRFSALGSWRLPCVTSSWSWGICGCCSSWRVATLRSPGDGCPALHPGSLLWLSCSRDYWDSKVRPPPSHGASLQFWHRPPTHRWKSVRVLLHWASPHTQAQCSWARSWQSWALGSAPCARTAEMSWLTCLSLAGVWGSQR